jgi:hypothetical protein
MNTIQQVRMLCGSAMLLLVCGSSAVAQPHWGTFPDSGTLYFYTNTVGTDGVAESLAGSPAIAVYKDGSATEFTTGATITPNFDTPTGIHKITIDTTATDFVAGSTYTVFYTAGTVDSVSVAGRIIGSFRLGTVPADVQTLLSQTITPHSNGYFPATIKDGTGTGEIDTSSGKVALTSTEHATIAADAGVIAQGTITAVVSATNFEVDIQFGNGGSTALLGDCVIVLYDTSVSGRPNRRRLVSFVNNVPEITINSATSFSGGTAVGDTFRIYAATNVGTNSSGQIVLQDGGITASKFGTGAIDANALSSDAAAEIIAQVSGTADSGTTTTLVDAALTQSDTDYWAGSWLLSTSGSTAGQIRRISEFNPATDTLAFDRPFTQAISTNDSYIILRTAGSDANVTHWLGTGVTTNVGGVPEVDVTHVLGSPVCD